MTNDNSAAQSHGSVPMEQIEQIVWRAFGPARRVVSTRELPGGTFNTTLLVTTDAAEPVVLRLAPVSAPTAWNTIALMRREHTIQPFFAPLAHLMPHTLLADFTHQLINRDYLVQTYLAGERWDDVAHELTPADETSLWQQFGQITRTIHAVRGDAFGFPYPEAQFPSWSQTIQAWLEQTRASAQAAQLDVHACDLALRYVRSHPAILDEIAEPRLLHGDLWLFNILISRGADGPRIVGILDADRACWGDPMADWTMFVLRKTASTAMKHAISRFWHGYGPPDQTRFAENRSHIYDVLHVGNALVWATQHNDQATIARGERDLRSAAAILATLL